MYQRKIEHIDNFSVEERRVIENHTVEKTVHNVAESSAKYGRQTEKDSGRSILLLEQLPYVKENYYDKRNPEETEQKLAETAPELHSEGHSVILYEQNLKPVAKNVNALAYGHIRLDQNLGDLIDSKKKCDKKGKLDAS